MANSSLTQTGERAPEVAGGDTRTLGPSDSSDTGSDMVGSGLSDAELDNDTDLGGSGERASADPTESGLSSQDIGADKIVDEDELDDTAD